MPISGGRFGWFMGFGRLPRHFIFRRTHALWNISAVYYWSDFTVFEARYDQESSGRSARCGARRYRRCFKHYFDLFALHLDRRAGCGSFWRNFVVEKKTRSRFCGRGAYCAKNQPARDSRTHGDNVRNNTAYNKFARLPAGRTAEFFKNSFRARNFFKRTLLHGAAGRNHGVAPSARARARRFGPRDRALRRTFFN